MFHINHIPATLLIISFLGTPFISSAQLSTDEMFDILLDQEFLKETTLLETSLFTQGACPSSPEGNPHTRWYLQRLNRSQSLDHYIIPDNLVDISPRILTKNRESICLQQDTAQELHRMTQDAQKLGLDIMVISGYRSYADQQDLYEVYAPQYNAGPHHRVAHPGYSEHHLGTTFDLAGVSQGYYAGARFAESPEGAWIQENGHSYGFIMSYPEGKEAVTGYQAEPWHWRYVGHKNAVLLTFLKYTLAFESLQNTYISPSPTIESGEIGG